MSVSINKNHSKNAILTNTDDAFYVYENHEWIRNKKVVEEDANDNSIVNYREIKYYKFFNTSKENILNYNELKVNDYVLTYLPYTNYIKYSQSPEYWGKSKNNNGNSVSLNDNSYKCPETNFSKEIRVLNGNDDNVSYYIKDEAKVKASKKNILTFLIKPIEGCPNKISIGFFDKSHNFGIIGKFDLYNLEVSPSIIYTDCDYNIITKPSSYIGLDEIKLEQVDNYFRVRLCFIPKISETMDIRLNLLNYNNDFKYKMVTGLNSILFCGAQLEIKDYNSNLTTLIDDNFKYIKTLDTPITVNLFDKIYQVKERVGNVKYLYPEDNDPDPHYSKIYYLTSTEDTYDDDGNIIMKSYEPKNIINPRELVDGDIAIVSSLINIVYEDYKTNALSVLGDKEVYGNNLPPGLIYYDIINKCYKIYDNESWKKIADKNLSNVGNEIVNAILFNTTRYETWCKYSPRYYFKKGINTGGGRNIWKR